MAMANNCAQSLRVCGLTCTQQPTAEDNINTGRERTGKEKVYGSFKISSFANLFNFPFKRLTLFANIHYLTFYHKAMAMSSVVSKVVVQAVSSSIGNRTTATYKTRR